MASISRADYLAMLDPKATRAPRSHEEQDIHKALVALLDVALSPGWRFFHCPNGELRAKATAALLISMGVKKGVFDLIFLSPAGTTYFLELKRPGIKERLTVEQQEWAAFFKSAGYPHGVASSVKRAIEILGEWGAVRKGTRVQ